MRIEIVVQSWLKPRRAKRNNNNYNEWRTG